MFFQNLCELVFQRLRFLDIEFPTQMYKVLKSVRYCKSSFSKSFMEIHSNYQSECAHFSHILAPVWLLHIFCHAVSVIEKGQCDSWLGGI